MYPLSHAYAYLHTQAYTHTHPHPHTYAHPHTHAYTYTLLSMLEQYINAAWYIKGKAFGSKQGTLSRDAYFLPLPITLGL